MNGTDYKKLFLLKDGVTFLNFGSFGACPRPVFERYQQFQLELEQEPVSFLTDKGPAYLKAARQALGSYLNCDEDDVVCVTNPSYAVNIIARSFPLQPGDEILTTDQEYGACDRTWKYYCERAGARYIQHPVSLPLTTREAFLESFLKKITPATRMIFISHLTSATALRMPVEEICAFAKEKGILTFIDGAHAPAQLPLDLRALGADIYTGACHKWMMAPKGSSFLYVRRPLQHLFDPLVISWGYNSMQPSHSRFLDYHELQGTRDISAFCTIPAAIDFMQEHRWEQVSAQCRRLAHENAGQLYELLQQQPPAPVHDDFMGQMVSCEVRADNAALLHDLLLREHHIQVPVTRHNDRFYLRYSINAFNSQEDLDKLFDALKKIYRKK